MNNYREIEDFASSWSLPEEWYAVLRLEIEKTGCVTEKAFYTAEELEEYLEEHVNEDDMITCYTEEVLTTSHYFEEVLHD